MAVYTEVPDDALAAFVADYDIGDVTACKGIAEGVENSNFLLYTTRGRYILTLYEKRVKPSDLPFFIALMRHLGQKGLPCPRPIAARNGEALGRLCDRPAAIISFLDGMWVRKPSERHCQMLGAALADMHIKGRDFGMRRTNDLSLDGWRTLAQQTADGADKVRQGLRTEIAAEIDHLGHRWPQGLETGVIHADLFPDNVFFLDDALSGIIDFYFACTDFLAYDLAVCLNAWCFEQDGSFNITKARAMFRGYEKHRAIPQNEIAALPILARGSALRFLLTRLYDWLNHPAGAFVKPKNPLEYRRKLRFHQKASDATAYGIG